MAARVAGVGVALLAMSINASVALDGAGAPTFKWSTSQPVIGRDFEKFRKAQLAKLPRNAVLEITGLYSAAEQQAAGNPTPNLGIARAAKTAAFFLAAIHSERIKLVSALVSDDGFTETTKKMAAFAAVSFADVPVVSSSQTATSSPQPRPKPIPILFPINKVIRHTNPAVDSYLMELARLLKLSSGRAILIGYADPRGVREVNLRLATQRAESIRAELVKLGVRGHNINIFTHGAPDTNAPDTTATDDSVNGRQISRRVDILIL